MDERRVHLEAARPVVRDGLCHHNGMAWPAGGGAHCLPFEPVTFDGWHLSGLCVTPWRDGLWLLRWLWLTDKGLEAMPQERCMCGHEFCYTGENPSGGAWHDGR